jgi:hypothetical protein
MLSDAISCHCFLKLLSATPTFQFVAAILSILREIIVALLRFDVKPDLVEKQHSLNFPDPVQSG